MAVVGVVRGHNEVCEEVWASLRHITGGCFATIFSLPAHEYCWYMAENELLKVQAKELMLWGCQSLANTLSQRNILIPIAWNCTWKGLGDISKETQDTFKSIRGVGGFVPRGRIHLRGMPAENMNWIKPFYMLRNKSFNVLWHLKGRLGSPTAQWQQPNEGAFCGKARNCGVDETWLKKSS